MIPSLARIGGRRTIAAVSTDNIESENLLDMNNDERFPNILVTGKTGVGKSRLVNSLVGKNVTKEGACKSAPYDAVFENVAVTVWDSPGLQNGTTNEARYIQDMKDNIKEIDLMIYCVRMDEARFHDADKKAIQTLTDEFGKEVWNHAVVALTFANKVEDPDKKDDSGYFQSQLEEWKKQFKEYFASIGIKPEVRIPVIPVGNWKKNRLPDRENWLSDLWIECNQVMKSSARHRPQNMFLQTALNAFISPAGVVVLTIVGTIFGGAVTGAVVGTIGLIALGIRRYLF